MVKDPKKRLGRLGADEILAHPWFGNLDRDALVMDQVESPYIPNKDINAAPQRSIGSFADTGSTVRSVCLTEPKRGRLFGQKLLEDSSALVEGRGAVDVIS